MLNDRIIEYINKFIKKLNITDYLGVIVYGSYVRNQNKNLSDLDVVIICENYETQDCGSMLIDGVRVEYFIQDIKRLYKLIKLEIENNDPSHLTKFATCEILYDKNNKIKEFIEYAKELYNTKIKSSFDDYDKFSIFSINNRMEDLESLICDESFYAVYFIVLEKIRVLYSRINGIIDLPIMKIRKLYTDEEYSKSYIFSEIHTLPNQDFINLYLKCLKIDDKNIMFNNLQNLYNYSFKDLDFNPTSFTLKFKSKAPFKV